jgi:hypothetical protein
MNTIVLNTLTTAVSEYSAFDFQSITPTHAGSATGLYALGGNLDVAAPIASVVTTGKTLFGASLKKFLGMVFFAVRGSGNATLTVVGSAASYSYTFPIRVSGESRCLPGRGIRENYLAFGFSNVAGAGFQLDRIEVDVAQSNSRRT